LEFEKFARVHVITDGMQEVFAKRVYSIWLCNEENTKVFFTVHCLSFVTMHEGLSTHSLSIVLWFYIRRNSLLWRKREM